MSTDDPLLNLFGSSSSEDEYDEKYDDEEDLNVQVGRVVSSSSFHHAITESMADKCVLFVTRHWLSPQYRSIPLSQRTVAIQKNSHTEPTITMNKMQHDFSTTLSARLETKGIRSHTTPSHPIIFDAAIAFLSLKMKEHHEMEEDMDPSSYRHIRSMNMSDCDEDTMATVKRFKTSLIHGGILLLNLHIIQNHNNNSNTKNPLKDILQHLHLTEAIWDVDHIQTLYESTWDDLQDDSIQSNNNNTMTQHHHLFISLAIRKRPCTINTKSCPWKYSSPFSSFTNNHSSSFSSKQKIPLSLWEDIQVSLSSSSSFSSSSSLRQHHSFPLLSSSTNSTNTNPMWTILQYEQYILDQVTITPSVQEWLSQDSNSNTCLSKENIQRAVYALQTYGFTIIRHLFHPQNLEPWIHAALEDFELACQILKQQHYVDLLHPGIHIMPSNNNNNNKSDSSNVNHTDIHSNYNNNNSHYLPSYSREPLSYKELAMREDFRVDLRDGPCLQQCRVHHQQSQYDRIDTHNKTGIPSTGGIQPSIVPTQYKGSYDSLRFHPDILQIIRQTFHPQDPCPTATTHPTQVPLYKGNYGRWNFEGSGPDGTPPPLRIGQVGSIISLPGAADQAIHADTPHLFEHVDILPCHYANLFIVGHDDPQCSVNEDGIPTGDSNVGGTAFIHGTHSLSVCAKLTTDNSSSTTASAASIISTSRDELYARIIRPSLTKGDAILFDCRVLHFGCANTSEIYRPLMYVNMTQAWFHDPKNWDMNTSIFS